MAEVVIYDGDNGWSAVYLNGKLQRVGDSYLADEWVREHFGVETIQSNDFMCGGTSRSDVATQLGLISAFQHERADRERRANELREQAARMIAEANELEGKTRD